MKESDGVIFIKYYSHQNAVASIQLSMIAGNKKGLYDLLDDVRKV